MCGLWGCEGFDGHPVCVAAFSNSYGSNSYGSNINMSLFSFFYKVPHTVPCCFCAIPIHTLPTPTSLFTPTRPPSVPGMEDGVPFTQVRRGRVGEWLVGWLDGLQKFNTQPSSRQ